VSAFPDGAAFGIATAMAMILWSRVAHLAQVSTIGLVLLHLLLPLVMPGLSFFGHLGGAAFGVLLLDLRR